MASDLKKYAQRGQATAIAQFYMLVLPGLILTRHVFKGLERPLYCDGNMDADSSKLVYSRTPSLDYEWVGGSQGEPVRQPAPENSAFVIIISPNINHRENYPNVAGWVERWNWVKEDSGLSEAPDNWVERYNCKLWTRGQL